MPSTDPIHVRAQYEREDNLRARQALYEDVSGDSAPDVLRATLARVEPVRVLEVGGGPGELAEWMASQLGAEVTMVDQSERMVELALARGVNAQLGDAQDLPFDDELFDTVVAAWMLYHVTDLEKGISEMARVLEPGGKVVVVTNSVEHLAELRALMDYSQAILEHFSRENGADWLRRYFSEVEQIDLELRITVHDREKLVAYQESISLPTRPVPDDVELPFVTFGRPTVFVATK
jgi:2-polyprenyl-3-methyl-5-hydroxy-6-metoxy-1,4-benzoquinol methylase